MLLLEIEPEVGHLYKFNYNGRARLALVRNLENDYMDCHDFTSNGPRRFSYARIKSVKDLTDAMLIVDVYDKNSDTVDSLVESYQDRGCLIFFGDDCLHVIKTS